MNTDIAAQHTLDHMKKAGVDALTEAERTLATAWLFEAGVGNSGFAGYFRSHRGDLAFNAPAALSAIGASELATIAVEANAVFGVNGPPKNRDERRRLVRVLPKSARLTLAELERRYDSCEEDIDTLLERFLAGKAI